MRARNGDRNDQVVRGRRFLFTIRSDTLAPVLWLGLFVDSTDKSVFIGRSEGAYLKRNPACNYRSSSLSLNPAFRLAFLLCLPILSRRQLVFRRLGESHPRVVRSLTVVMMAMNRSNLAKSQARAITSMRRQGA